MKIHFLWETSQTTTLVELIFLSFFAPDAWLPLLNLVPWLFAFLSFYPTRLLSLPGWVQGWFISTDSSGADANLKGGRKERRNDEYPGPATLTMISWWKSKLWKNNFSSCFIGEEDLPDKLIVARGEARWADQAGEFISPLDIKDVYLYLVGVWLQGDQQWGGWFWMELSILCCICRPVLQM